MKRYLTGSCLFFKDYPDFDPHDVDYCELHNSLHCLFIQDETADWDVYQWRRATPEEYVSYALSNNVPWQLMQFLTPLFCKEVGFTTEHLKQLKPLRDSMDDRHSYIQIIYDSFVENGDYFLTRQQLDRAYADYKEKRKYDYFFRKN